MEKNVRLSKLFGYAFEFYVRKLPQLLVFSVPTIFAFLIPFFVPAPTFSALGAVILRTGSLPDMSLIDIAFTAIAYLISLFIIADAIANINLLIKSKRTRTSLKSEVFSALTTYAVRILYVYTTMLLLFAVFQLITFELPFQTFIYPLLVLALSFLLFFTPPALVIDNEPVEHAVVHSAKIALSKPILFFVWIITGFILISVIRLFFGFLLPSFAPQLTLLFNAIFILPFLIILQTQLYMEKYPLAH